MKQHIAYLTVPIAIACVMASCSMAPRIVLFNHTGQNVTASQRHGIIEIQQGTSQSFIYPGANSNTFAIVAGQHVWIYARYPYPPEDYWQRRGHERYDKIKMQIEPDGAIYVVHYTNEFPLIDLSAQPDGFPVKPETKPNQVPENTGPKLADPRH